MKNTLKIRYKFINNLVNKLYLSLGLTTYPISFETIENAFSNIKFIAYSKFMNDFSIKNDKILNYFSSLDGCCDYKPSSNQYIIYYNDITIKNKKRILWTIIHELGHIFCHKNLIKLAKENDIIYQFTESEANYFASIFLAHPIILQAIDIHNSYELEVFCNLSTIAAKYRYSNYQKYILPKNITYSNKEILNNFKDFINSTNTNYKEHLLFISSLKRKLIN